MSADSTNNKYSVSLLIDVNSNNYEFCFSFNNDSFTGWLGSYYFKTSATGPAKLKDYSSNGVLTTDVSSATKEKVTFEVFKEYSGESQACVYQENAVRTITFNANGGTGGTTSISNKYWSQTIASSEITNPTYAGHTFLNWCSDEELTQDVTFPYTIDGNATLYAKWHPIQYGVLITATNGTLSDGEQSGESSISFAAIKETTWTTDGSNIVFTFNSSVVKTITVTPNSEVGYDIKDLTVTQSSGTVTDNVEINARYSRVAQKYNISFDANGGTGSKATVTASYNVKFTIPGANGITSPSGHEFSHWNTEADNTGTIYNQGEQVYFTGDTTLYAQWKTASANQPIYVKNNTGNPDFVPYVYLYNSESSHIAWPGVAMTKVQGTDDLFSYSPTTYYSHMVITDGVGSESDKTQTQKSGNISIDRISYNGYNMMYNLNLNTAQDATTAYTGIWTARNWYMNGKNDYPSGNTMRLWVDRNTSTYGTGYTWVYHYWEGATDVEVIATNYANMSKDSGNARYLAYIDVPTEAVNKNGQWKVYNDVTGEFVASSDYIYSSVGVYATGTNSKIFYMNDSALDNITVGSLSSSISDANVNVDNYYLVMQAYCTCSSSKDNGYGNISGDNSVTSTWRLSNATVVSNLSGKTLVDYSYASGYDYSKNRGVGISIGINDKVTMMTSLKEGNGAAAPKNRFVRDEQSKTNNIIVIVVLASSVVAISALGLIIVLKKKKAK